MSEQGVVLSRETLVCPRDRVRLRRSPELPALFCPKCWTWWDDPPTLEELEADLARAEQAAPVEPSCEEIEDALDRAIERLRAERPRRRFVMTPAPAEPAGGAEPPVSRTCRVDGCAQADVCSQEHPVDRDPRECDGYEAPPAGEAEPSAPTAATIQTLAAKGERTTRWDLQRANEASRAPTAAERLREELVSATEPAGEAEHSAPGAGEKSCGTCEYPSDVAHPRCDICLDHDHGCIARGEPREYMNWEPHPALPPAEAEGECPFPYVKLEPEAECGHYRPERERTCGVRISGNGNPCPTCPFPEQPHMRAVCWLNIALRKVRTLVADRDRLREDVKMLQDALVDSERDLKVSEDRERDLRERLGASESRADGMREERDHARRKAQQASEDYLLASTERECLRGELAAQERSSETNEVRAELAEKRADQPSAVGQGAVDGEGEPQPVPRQLTSEDLANMEKAQLLDSLYPGLSKSYQPEAPAPEECPHFSDERGECRLEELGMGVYADCRYSNEQHACVLRRNIAERDRLRKRVGELQEQVEFCSSNETDRQRNRAEAAEADLGVAIGERDRLRADRDVANDAAAKAILEWGKLRGELAAEKQRAEQAEAALASCRLKSSRRKRALKSLQTSVTEWRRRFRIVQESWRQAEARANAAEEKAKGCFRLPNGRSHSGFSKDLRQAVHHFGVSAFAERLRGYAECIERGPEGGEGVWVTREQVRSWAEGERSMDDWGDWRRVCQFLGIPAEWLAPETGEGSDE